MMHHDDFIRYSLRSDELRKEISRMEYLITKLVYDENMFRYSEAPVYGTHKETGLVYDVRFLKDKVVEMRENLAELETKLAS